MSRINSFYASDQRYASLRVVSFLCTLIGVALLVVGAVLLAIGLSAVAEGMMRVPPQGAAPFGAPPGNAGNTVPFVPWLGGTFSLVWSSVFLISGLQLIASGVLFKLMIHLEENTRASAQILDKIRSRLESSREGVEPLFRA
jgi:hypothetical protein